MDNEKTIETIKEIIESIRPYINFDGGDIEFVKYEENYVYIKLLGACQMCGMIDTTIENGIYENIKEKVPEVKGVINIPL